MKPPHTQRGPWRWALLMVALLGAAVLAGVSFGSPALREWTAPLLGSGETHRETTGNGRSPTISFIDSPSPTCYRPEPGTGTCYIQWNYLAVSTAPASTIISMTLSIEGQVRAYHSGFFQSAMVIPQEMTGPGYEVVCGLPGSEEAPEWGNSYSYDLSARDSAGTKAANSGTVACPADAMQAYIPTIQR